MNEVTRLAAMSVCIASNASNARSIRSASSSSSRAMRDRATPTEVHSRMVLALAQLAPLVLIPFLLLLTMHVGIAGAQDPTPGADLPTDARAHGPTKKAGALFIPVIGAG